MLLKAMVLKIKPLQKITLGTLEYRIYPLISCEIKWIHQTDLKINPVAGGIQSANEKQRYCSDNLIQILKHQMTGCNERYF